MIRTYALVLNTPRCLYCPGRATRVVHGRPGWQVLTPVCTWHAAAVRVIGRRPVI